jgi:O-antigen/teichoic acid export membrane protein
MSVANVDRGVRSNFGALKGVAVVGAGMILAQAAAWLLMLVAARSLGPTEYGAFGALSVILLIASTCALGLQVVVARQVAAGGTHRAVSRWIGVQVGVIAMLVVLALSPLLTRLLQFSTWLSLALTAATLLPLAVTYRQLGLLQGAQLHWRLGALYAISAGSRAAFGIAGAVVYGTAFAAVLGSAVGAALGAAAGVPFVRGFSAWDRNLSVQSRLLREVGHATHSLIALYALTNVDVLVARTHFTSFESGLYAAGALITRIVFFLSTAVVITAFPHMVSDRRRGIRTKAVILVAVIGGSAVVACGLFPTLAINAVAGESYETIAEFVWVFGLTGTGFGVIQVLLYSQLAKDQRWAAITLWVGALGVVVIGSTLGASGPRSLAVTTAGVAWTLALVSVLVQRRAVQKQRHAQTQLSTAA